MNSILAKSAVNGGTLLVDHLKHVECAINKIAIGFGCDSNEIVLAKQAAFLHDIGKTHSEFQKILINGREHHSIEIPLRHEISSLLFLPAFDKNNWNTLIEYIVAHHKSIGSIDHDRYGDKGFVYLCNHFDKDDVFDRHSAQWDMWMPNAITILNEVGYGCSDISLEQAKAAFEYSLTYCENIIRSHKYALSWRKGILVAADHMASALGEKVLHRAEKLFKTPDISNFNQVEVSEENVRLYPLSSISTEDKRPHTMVKAPTGAGKTDFLIRRCKGRIFYTLPFQASINAMYKRLKDRIPDSDVRFLHASSQFKENDTEEKVLQDKVGASVKVLTPHQLSALITGARGYEAIAIDIMGCDIILDEVHSYSDSAQAMVMEIIRVLKKFGCRIHIGTATMPSALEKHIRDILGGEESVYSVTLSSEILQDYNRHIINKVNSFDLAIILLKGIYSAPNANEKCLIVCNRVDIAQERFKVIKDLFPDIHVFLLHSRYKRKDRNTKEEELTSLFLNDKPCIVISTQIVEVSLDISADCMITDCAPLDSLVQRFGRVHRKRLLQYLGTYKNIYVIAPPAHKSDALPYDLELLENSFKQLDDGKVFQEIDLQDKLDKVYPEVHVPEKDVFFIWKGENFTLPELCHYSISPLLEMLKIDSKAAITYEDMEKYKNGDSEERSEIEIPVPRSIKYKKVTNYGYLDYGACPLVIANELYNSEIGLQLNEIEQIL